MNELLKKDYDIVQQCGMTEQEAECWQWLTLAANAFFALPVIHPNDKNEVSEAIHVVQSKLMARPTYKKYLQLHNGQSE